MVDIVIDLENPTIGSISNSLMPIIEEYNKYVPYLAILEALILIPDFDSSKFNDFEYINSIIIELDCGYEVKQIWYNDEGDVLYQFIESEQ